VGEAAGTLLPMTSEAVETLRSQITPDGWARIRVELLVPDLGSVTDDATLLVQREETIEQTELDLLFALPPGSYQRVQRPVGTTELILRVNTAGLDAALNANADGFAAGRTSLDRQVLATDGARPWAG
jgi:hypothetical protein